MINSISTNRKELQFVSPIDPNKIVQQENNDILDEILVSLFNCFLNPLPDKIDRGEGS